MLDEMTLAKISKYALVDLAPKKRSFYCTCNPLKNPFINYSRHFIYHTSRMTGIFAKFRGASADQISTPSPAVLGIVQLLLVDHCCWQSSKSRQCHFPIPLLY